MNRKPNKKINNSGSCRIERSGMIIRILTVMLLSLTMMFTSQGMVLSAFATQDDQRGDAASATEQAKEADSEQSETVVDRSEKQSDSKNAASLDSKTDGSKSSDKAKGITESDSKAGYTSGKLTAKDIDYQVIVTYSAKAKIPEGATLSVSEISSDDSGYKDYVEATADAVFKDEDTEADTLPYARFFDITIKDDNGGEIEPSSAVRVKIDLKDDALKTEDVDFTAVHFKEESGDKGDLTAELIELDTKDNAAFEAESFSTYGVAYYYTVDFYYIPDGQNGEDVTATEYQMNGGSAMLMSDLFDKLGIDRDTDDIKKIDFSDNSLVKFTKTETGEGEEKKSDINIESLKPFTTSEALTITFTDGEVIVIDVEDAVTQYGAIPNSNGKAYYEFDSATGELRIRALNGATETAYVNDNFTAKGAWPWDNIRSQVKKISFTKGTSGYGVGFAGVANFAFADMVNLTEVDFSGMGEIRANGIARMFSGCTSLTEIDMSMVTTNGNLSNMQNMFNGCKSLKTVTLNNSEFKTRNEADKTGAQLTGMFDGCSSLEEVDMSNITLTGNNINIRGLDNPFTGSSVKKIIMDNVKFVNVKTTKQFMKSLSNLEEVSMTGNVDASSVQYMTEMFAQNPSLKKIDVSGFGKLDSIVNMQDFVKDDTALETLIIDGMDNSHIGPKNSRHHISEDNSVQDNNVTSITGAAEYGRDFGLKTCTSLKTLSAKDAKVWMVNNNRGIPGSEYYSAASDKDIFWWWMTTEEPGDNGRQLKFEADGDKGTYTLNKRDYVDLITDRDGSAENTHTINPPQSSLPDADKNINIQNDLNPHGAGFLAPGVYTILDSAWETEQVSFPDSYYRISYIGEVPFEVRVNGQKVTLNDGQSETVGKENNLVVAKSPNSNNIYINTTKMTWPTSGTKTLDDTIEVVYKDAAIDINGKKHDVVITINKITFKDLDKVPTHEDRGNHNQNRYYDTDGGGQYYRTIMQARSDGTIFRDLLRISDPATPWIETSALSGGAGTDIDFTVKIDKANQDTSFIFYVDDLDVSYSQNWEYPKQDDPCYDTLTPQNSTYGLGGEGFILNDGNDLNTVTFADHTGLFLYQNNVLTTGSDPSTSWSEFAVKAKADGNGSSYTWTSGIGCSTYVLRNTPKMNTGSITIQPQVNKALSPGGLENDQFTFELKKVSTDPSGAPEPDNLPQTKKNDASGTVTFDPLVFKANGTNSLIYDSDNTPYYPGTSPANNSSGEGTHNTFTYTYEVREVAGTDQNIVYDTSTHTIQIKIITPENDDEMTRGIKAEIYVDGSLEKTVWEKTLANPVNLASLVFSNSKVQQKDTKSVTRTITYTEDTVGGNEVAPDKIQKVDLEKVWYLDSRGNPVDENGNAVDLSTVPWKIDSGDTSSVKSPDHAKKSSESWNPDIAVVDTWNVDLLNPQDEVVNVIYTKDTYTDSTETKTITRTITYTEKTVNGKKVAEPVIQTVILERTIRTNDRTGEKTYGNWTIKSGDASSVDSPSKKDWVASSDVVDEWQIDLTDPKDEFVYVIYMPVSDETIDDGDDTDDTGVISKVKKAVQTGDYTILWVWVVLLAAALCAVILAIVRRRRK